MPKISNSRVAPKVPYRGIESFRFCDRDIFFAREQEIQELLRFVTMYRGVLFYGDSGSGKSSLINAGFLPVALREKFVPHRLRVQPRSGEEFVVESISTTPGGGAPYLPSVFTSDNSEPRQVLSVTKFKRGLAQFRISDLEERIVLSIQAGKDPLSRYIKSHLSNETTHLLGQYKDSLGALPDKTRAAFTADLQELLRTKPLYSKSRFSNVNLPDEILGLLTSDLKSEESIRLNRLLLEQAYPGEPMQREQLPLLIFDQFEEFVTLFEIAPRGEALKEAQVAQQAILETLVDLLKNTSLAIKLVFVFREDYLAKLTKLFVQRPELTDQYLRLTSIKVERLTDIIKSPFQKFPGTFKPEFSDTLVDELRSAFESRSELGTVNLSEVQTTCLRLWQSSDPQNLFRQKGIQGLLEDYLLDSLNKFPEELRDPSVALLTRLVTDSGTRNVVSRDDLILRLVEDEGIPRDLLEQSLDKLENDTKLIRRERRYETFFFEIVSEFLVDWIRKQRIERRIVHERRTLVSQIERSKFEEKAREKTTGTSFTEREFIAGVEAAGADEFAVMLLRPTREEEMALRRFFGDERYQNLHSLALRRHITRLSGQVSGNVIIIPGFGGTSLSVSDGGVDEPIWMNVFGIMRRGLEALRLSSDSRALNSLWPVRPTGVLKRFYGELILSLAQNWNVKTFAYDWRKDLNLAADELKIQAATWFGSEERVHIVAHSTGGLVAQMFLKRYPEQWKAFWDVAGNGKAGGRLILLGTPCFGTFKALQVLTGLDGMIKKLSLLDERRELRKPQEIFKTFPGLYQMLPSPRMAATRELYNSETYKRFNLDIPQQHLDYAKKHHELRLGSLSQRMIYIAGHKQPTPVIVADWNKLDKNHAYTFTYDGDGVVPHRLAPLSTPFHDAKVRSYWIEETHGNLPSNRTVLKALDSILTDGGTGLLPELLHTGTTSRVPDRFLAQYDTALASDVAKTEVALRALNVTPAGAANAYRSGMPMPSIIAAEERKVEEQITRGFLDYRFDDAVGTEVPLVHSMEEVTIEVAVVHGDIGSVSYETLRTTDGDPVDSIAVGHYMGVDPIGAELVLDRAISASLQSQRRGPNNGTSHPELLLTTYTNCGLIQGALGQLFFIQDPRRPKRKSKLSDRQVVIAGMGEAGYLGVPELTVLSQNLVWALGMQNKKHLATVLIGSGEGNLALRDAVSAWLNGLGIALAGLAANKRLRRITFVEFDPRKVLLLNRALIRECQESSYGFAIEYKPLSNARVVELEYLAEVKARRDLKDSFDDDRESFPARVSVTLNPAANTYGFAAITSTGLIPKRDMLIDPQLTWTANNELIAERLVSTQLERGRFLEQLLLPAELRKQLYGSEPLVLMLDSNSARIHWEMVAQPSMSRSPRPQELPGARGFLGTERAVTRQLRTATTAPIEPFTAQRNVLEVLIVADPASDARLPGAEAEGALLADLFHNYNLLSRETHVEVKCLFGSIDATRTNVLRELMLRRYDVLHFAGNCVFEWEGDPNLSGWIFNAKRKELLSPNEFSRIDRIPKFVFSNALETGLTPDHASDRNDALAPAFAEAFFARGVQNFVCQAWPIEDETSRAFVLNLYSNLLGISYDGRVPSLISGLPMNEAMRTARLHIAAMPSGETAWGAYQHYGNPYFRFFSSPPLRHSTKVAQGKRRASKVARAKPISKKSTKK